MSQFLNESQAVLCWHQHETLAYCPPTCWSFRIGLNENENTFIATRWRFWSSKIVVSPGNKRSTVLTNTALSGITGMMKWKWEQSDQSPQISIMQRRLWKNKLLNKMFGSCCEVKINVYFKTMKVFFNLASMSACCWGLPKPNYEPFITHNRGTLIKTIYTYVNLDHKTRLKSLGYICSNSQKCIVWVKTIYFYFMPKIIRTLSKDHVPLRYLVNFLW